LTPIDHFCSNFSSKVSLISILCIQRRDSETVLAEFAPKMNWKGSATTPESILDVGCGSGDFTAGLIAPTAGKLASSASTEELATALTAKLASSPSKLSIFGRHKKRGGSDSESSSIGDDDDGSLGAVKVVGVDVSNEMVQHAKNRFSSRSITFSQLDIGRDLPSGVTTMKFNKVFSFYCLHWVKDQSAAFRNVHRLLEDDGECLLVYLASNPLFDAYRRLAQKPRWSNVMSDVETFVPATQDETDPALAASTRLRAVGLQIAVCETRKSSFTFPNANGLAMALRAVSPFMSRLQNDSEKSQHLAELMAELSDQRDAEGNFVAEYTLLVVHARKPANLNESSSSYASTTLSFGSNVSPGSDLQDIALSSN